MASCKNDFICTLLVQFFYSFFVCSADLEKLCTRSFSPYVKVYARLFMPCLRADVSYFQCCNKGNRRHRHAGKSRTDPRCGFKSNRWSRDQVNLVPRAFHPFFEGKALGTRLEIRCNQVSPTRLRGSMLGGCDCTKAIESLPRRVFALKW